MKNENYYVFAQPKAIGGFVNLCNYCGEGISKGQKLCKICKTKKGREEILEANKQVLKGLRSMGYCLNDILLPVV